jgi:hypothetical protein
MTLNRRTGSDLADTQDSTVESPAERMNSGIIKVIEQPEVE